MDGNSSYTDSLIEESKKGRNNSFIKLSLVYLPKTFSLVFALVPIRNEAIKICSESFLVAWRKIQTIHNSDTLEKLIIKAVLIRCTDYLSNSKI